MARAAALCLPVVTTACGGNAGESPAASASPASAATASATPEPPEEPLPPGAVEERCVNSGHGIVAAHTDPRLSLSDLARVHALGRIEPNVFRLDPPGRYRFVTVAPIFVDSGRIAVRCDFSLAGHVYTGPATYGGGPSVTPAVRSVIFFLGPATGSSTPGASAPSTSNP